MSLEVISLLPNIYREVRNEESMSSVITFIDQFVTVDVTNSDLAPYIKYHVHSDLKKVCRFGIPSFYFYFFI